MEPATEHHHHFCRWFSDLTPAEAFARAFPDRPSPSEASHKIDGMSPRELRVRAAASWGRAEGQRGAGGGGRRVWGGGAGGGPPVGVRGQRRACRPPRASLLAPSPQPYPTALPHSHLHQGVFAAIFGSPTTSNNTTWVRAKIKSGEWLPGARWRAAPLGEAAGSRTGGCTARALPAEPGFGRALCLAWPREAVAAWVQRQTR